MRNIYKKLLPKVLSVSMVFTMTINVSAYTAQVASQNTVHTIDSTVTSTSSNLSSTGKYMNLYNIEDSVFSNAIYVSADGSSGAAGTTSSPLDLASAIKQATSRIMIRYNTNSSNNITGKNHSFNYRRL